ncbi:cell wall protein TIR4-like [Juglans microcarpa x Juglans regia]|uniref:cell wall protein TIR4-like n=1 Tax=Juglans microcarpa x Juglans regia TaxID=2249226 RepID=UPI001B7DF254|nr:cell wall protein TIR4-like [Juglans microcarpa x Juglans regia]
MSNIAALSSSANVSSTAALYSSAIPMMGPPPTAYPYPWSNQQHPWTSTSAPMSSSASSVSSSVAASSSVQTCASVAASSCSALPTFVTPTSTNTYPCGSEENKVQQSNSVEEISEATLDSIEVEAQSTASFGNTVDTNEAGTDGGDITEEPKPGMRFDKNLSHLNCQNELPSLHTSRSTNDVFQESKKRKVLELSTSSEDEEEKQEEGIHVRAKRGQATDSHS